MKRVTIGAVVLAGLLLGSCAGWAVLQLFVLPHPRGLTAHQQIEEWRQTVRFVAGAFAD